MTVLGSLRIHGIFLFVLRWALPSLIVVTVACGSDDPSAQRGCPEALPSGCECIDDRIVCEESPAGDGDGEDVVADGDGDDTIEGDGDSPGDGDNNDAMEDASPGDAEVQGDGDGEEPNKATGYVGEHGRLRVKGNRVVDREGKSLQLRGMSLFWSQWTDFYVAKNVDVLVDDWKATVVRAALGVENDAGYLQNASANTEKVRTVVDQAIAKGTYVIIDWHDHHAQDHKAQAVAFFKEMAQRYGHQPHVMFEIYNEPMDVQWSTVKSYADELIKTIRDTGSKNLIIVGTPTWSQDVDIAANSPITSDDNVAYTLHFYANTHKQALRDKAKAALDKGIALFVTEWGTCSADGNGSISEIESQSWLNFLSANAISWANWALNNKAEACSAITSSGPSTGPWRDDQLTTSGRLVKAAIP